MKTFARWCMSVVLGLGPAIGVVAAEPVPGPFPAEDWLRGVPCAASQGLEPVPFTGPSGLTAADEVGPCLDCGDCGQGCWPGAPHGSGCLRGCRHCGHTCACYPPGDMVPHTPYITWKTYYYFRPYNFLHVAEHQQLSVAAGIDAALPYSQAVFQSVYESMPELSIPPAEVPVPAESLSADVCSCSVVSRPRGDEPIAGWAAPPSSWTVKRTRRIEVAVGTAQTPRWPPADGQAPQRGVGPAEFRPVPGWSAASGQP